MRRLHIYFSFITVSNVNELTVKIHIHLYKRCGNKYIYPVAPRARANVLRDVCAKALSSGKRRFPYAIAKLRFVEADHTADRITNSNMQSFNTYPDNYSMRKTKPCPSPKRFAPTVVTKAYPWVAQCYPVNADYSISDKPTLTRISVTFTLKEKARNIKPKSTGLST